MHIIKKRLELQIYHLDKLFIYLLLFILFLYLSPNLPESDEALIHKVSNYPDLLAEIPRYCCPLVI